MRPVTDDDRRIMDRFAASLNMLDEMEAYWCPERGRVAFRSVTATRRFSLPPDVVLIGRYAYPFAAREFLQDVDDALARLQVATLARLAV